MTRIPSRISIGDKYGPAMEILEQGAADAYFELLVEHSTANGLTRDAAERIERANLGYFAGYYGHEVRARVERLFRCSHPFFGAIAACGAPTPEEAFGMRLGATQKDGAK